MNTNKSETPKSMTPMQCELENINLQLGRIEKAVAVAMENFIRFNAPANALNPEDYFRNHPQAVGDRDNLAMKETEGADYVKSGHILKLSDLNNYAKVIEAQVNDFTENHIVPVAYFFERNI